MMVEHLDETIISMSPISRLPVDIQLEVFDHVRSRKVQGNVRLVSHKWNDLMIPQTWRLLSTNLQIKDLQNLEKFPKDRLKHIRELRIRGICLESDLSCHIRFRRVMGLLSDGQLLKFESTQDIPLSSRSLLELLRLQQNLRSFSALLDFSDVEIWDQPFWLTTHTGFLNTALRLIDTLRIYLKDTKTGREREKAVRKLEMSCSRQILSAASRVHHLEICGIISGQGITTSLEAMFDNLESDNSTHMNVAAKTLLISHVNFYRQEGKLLSFINIDTLQSLNLDSCHEVAPLVNMLATSFRQTGSQLRDFAFRVKDPGALLDERGLSTALVRMLSSFSGLKELKLHLGYGDLFDWEESLQPHRKSLKKLLIESVIMEVDWTSGASLVGQILRQCTNIEQFAYTPGDPRLGKVIDLNLPPKLDPCLRESLEVIALAPGLRILRLLYAPGIPTPRFDRERLDRQEPHWGENARIMVQHLAAQVLTYLRNRGSNIMLLAISPCGHYRRDRCDSNGHYHPNYYYEYKSNHGQGDDVVNAAPIRTCLEEYPNATILTSS